MRKLTFYVFAIHNHARLVQVSHMHVIQMDFLVIVLISIFRIHVSAGAFGQVLKIEPPHKTAVQALQEQRQGLCPPVFLYYIQSGQRLAMMSRGAT